MTAVHWPAGHEIAGADIHAANDATTEATPEQVWAWLVRPDRWGQIYGNAWRVRPVDGPWPEVALGTRFTWITFGAPVTTTITEFEPGRRLAWSGSGLGATGHHAWVLEPAAGGGCRILTEETQRGSAVKVLAPLLRPAMLRFHQRWVDALARVAAQRSPE